MHPFGYARPARADEAIAAGADPHAMFLAGGTELLNWMRLGVVAPERVIDISRIGELERIESLPGGGLRIGNLATIGGNPVQRTRCQYFRAEETLPCNKRVPGSGCSALHGLNEKHAIFGWTDDCVAVQPSDPAVALAALDAVIVTQAGGGSRRIPAREFHTLPADGPERDNVLRHGELITAIELPGPAPHSAYLNIRERESYEYATVSAAAVVELAGEVIRRARIALGSVAHRPWRLDEAERRLIGMRPSSAEVPAAIDAAFANARPLSHNAYKIPLARNAALRVLQTAARLP